MYRSFGDPRTEEGRKLLAERSPINKVENIKKPMLIFHGARCALQSDGKRYDCCRNAGQKYSSDLHRLSGRRAWV